MIANTQAGTPSNWGNGTSLRRGIISLRFEKWFRSGLGGGWGVSVNCSGVSVFQELPGLPAYDPYRDQ
jgi:hypothetical protein